MLFLAGGIQGICLDFCDFPLVFALQELGLDPKPVPPRVFVPLLESASIENDGGLQQKWAGLLATAADPRRDDPLSPCFVEILRQISPFEARLLHGIWLRTRKAGDAHWSITWRPVELVLIAVGQNIVPEAVFSAVRNGELHTDELTRRYRQLFFNAHENFIRLGILKESSRAEMVSRGRPQQIKFEYVYTLTSIGKDFLDACEGPQLQENKS